MHIVDLEQSFQDLYSWLKEVKPESTYYVLLQNEIDKFYQLPIGSLLIKSTLAESFNKTKQTCQDIMKLYFIDTYHQDPIEVIKEWFKLASSVSFQGGTGHSFDWKPHKDIIDEYPPHHLVIGPQDYQRVLPSGRVQLACRIYEFRFSISARSHKETWGN